MADTQVHTEVVGNTITTTNNKNNNKRSRGWMFTWNNPPEGKESATLDYLWDNSLEAKYMIAQLEVGENKTPHIQGFIYWSNPRCFGGVKKLLPKCHIEAAIKIELCIKYCSKEETRINGPWEWGDKPQQGKRTDLKEVADAIINGSKAIDIAISNPEMYVKYTKGLKALETAVIKHREYDKESERIWIWGGSGIGKTKYVVDNEPELYIKDGTQWWDNYNYEPAILIDDFDGKWPYRDLLRLLDRYAYQGQYKGGYIKITSPRIYITCEFPPQDFWEGNELKQITRRLTCILDPKFIMSLDEERVSSATSAASL